MRQLENPRAQRRHDRERLKIKRRFHYGQDQTKLGQEKTLASIINTPCSCSCFICGNPRRYFGALSMQERRAYQRKLGEL